MASSTSCMPFQLFRSWSKASKCKKLIKQISYHLKLLEARKSVIINQTGEDIIKLLQAGQFQLALKLAGELHNEQTRIAAYEIINELCECISNNFSFIRKKRDLPNDVSVAVSSLIFAASRCGELPELNKLRSLFRGLYGNGVDSSNVNLMPSNLVKIELKNTLSADSISEIMKLELISKIIRDSAVTMHPLQNGQEVYDITGEKGVPKEEDECLASINLPNCTTETRTLTGGTVKDDQKLELVEERRMNSTNQALSFSIKAQGRKMVQQKPQTVSKLDEDGSPRESIDSTYQIQEREIIYIDDIAGTSPPPRPRSTR